MHFVQSDEVRTVVVHPAITRAFWSQSRAWNGGTLRLHIETRNVPDGTPVHVEIWEDDSGEGSPDDFVAELDQPGTVDRGRCTIEHTLTFDDETMGEPLELEGDTYEFYFRARIDDYGLEARSNLLFVALEEFRPSR